MALESFYGGKQGVSPVIKAKFKYINKDDEAYVARLGKKTHLTKEEARWLNDVFNTTKYAGWTSTSTETTAGASGVNTVTWTATLLAPFTMDECLKNVNYTDVWFGELCIIDTDSKYNKYNGMLFKRTLKQVDNRFAGTEYTLYAEYIGQIVGPMGGTPSFDFGSLDTERKKAVGTVATNEDDIIPLDTTYWDYSYKSTSTNKITTEHPSAYDKIAISSAGVPEVNTNGTNIQMVPGKIPAAQTSDNEDEDKYNDTIRYTWCNVHRKGNDGVDEEAWIYLGFEIPYTVFEAAGQEENYTYSGSIFQDNSDPAHPFAKSYTFHIPRGARGIGPEQLYIVGKDGRTKPNTIYEYDAITYTQATDTYSVNTEKKIANSDSRIANDKTYWVAKWVLYNPKTTTTTTVYQYIGDYKDISSISLSPGGVVTINYSNGESVNLRQKLTWVTSATASVDTNLNNSTFGNYSFTMGFNNNDNDVSDISLSGNLPLVKAVSYNDTTGKITLTYTGGGTRVTSNPIKYITGMTVNTSSPTSTTYGQITGTYNTKDEHGDFETTYIGTLPLIKDVTYNPETKLLTFDYTGNAQDVIGPLNIKDIYDMRINNGELEVKYSTDPDTWDSVGSITASYTGYDFSNNAAGDNNKIPVIGYEPWIQYATTN